MAITINNQHTLSVNLEAIRAALNETYAVLSNGQTGNDLGFLCRSSKINPKSKNKPVCSSSTAALTDAQRKALNYGNTMQFYTSLSEAMQNVAAGTTVGYAKPSGGVNQRYRLYDFNGYDHNAGNWFEMSTDATEANGSCYVSCAGSILNLFDLGFLTAYSPSNGGIQFGFAVQSSAYTNAASSMYFYPLTGALTISDIIGEDKMFISLQGELSIGTWYLFPMLTTANYAENEFTYISANTYNGQWFPIPYCDVFTLSVTAAARPIDKISAQFGSGSAIETSMYNWSISQVYITFSNSGTTSVTLYITSEMTDRYSGNGTYSRGLTLAAGQSVEIDVLNGTSLNYESVTNYPTIEITYTAANGGGSKSSSYMLVER